MHCCRKNVCGFLAVVSILYSFFSNFAAQALDTKEEKELEKVKKWLKQYNAKAEDIYNENTQAQWAYVTNLTDYNLKTSSESDARLSDFKLQMADQASEFDDHVIKDQSILRELMKIKTVGIRLNSTDSLELSSLSGNMSGIYGKGSICSINELNLVVNCSNQWPLDPDITDFMAHTRNYDALLYVWRSWHDTVGKPIKKQYADFVDLSNKGARAGGFNDTGAWWRWPYEDPDFEKSVDQLWLKVLPLYEQLHAFVRRGLTNLYPNRFNTSTIPAHVLGNVWAQDWSNLFDLLVPYTNKTSVDVTKTMQKQNMSVLRMFHLADEFFTSLGLIPMTPAFWNKSMFVKPTDGRSVVCHASAWDFYKQTDVRIKMCTKVDMDNLLTVHHEMGHIQYYLNYGNLSIEFREGANPGFHEAIGDTMALSSSTPEHLKALGLLPDYERDYDQDINYLLKMALEKIAFLPWGYLVDKWRWNVFNGQYDFSEWNRRWWQLRYEIQGVVPPVNRSEDEQLFDAGAKYHVPANSPYMSYFVSFIVQFQFYESMCKAAGYHGPLYHCDFYKSKAAGDLLGGMMKMGSSEPWPVAMNRMTGQTRMDSSSLLTYFEPLNAWLAKENDLHKACYGWGKKWPKHVEDTLPKPRCEYLL